jgi:hypothetical protein
MKKAKNALTQVVLSIVNPLLISELKLEGGG